MNTLWTTLTRTTFTGVIAVSLIACTLQPETTTVAPSTVSNVSAAEIPAGAVRYVIASGSEASYTVSEVLAGNTLPNDAVGTTDAVTGAIALDTSGKVVAAASTITVNLTGLTSDSSMRDGFIQRSTLETGTYPNATFAINEISGLPASIPTSGDYTVAINGNLTLHGVTRPATWNGTVTFKDGGVTGTASTIVKLTDFGMTEPSVARVLSIEDNITLTIDLTAKA